MKTVFIVNPKAGRERKIEDFIDKIKSHSEDAEIYVTKSVGDATDFCKHYCVKNGPARFIACGGDGTLSEVINGAVEFEGVEIGVIPMGTGNDFCRNFGESAFESIKSQMTGKSVRCDVIKYTTEIGNARKTGYCVNMFNIGFDCNVVDATESMKKKPFVAGSLAYFLGILVTLVKKKGAKLRIELDGVEKHNGELLLTSLANGCFCGGGIKSNPLASVQDGFININLIKNVSRLKFIYLLPFYMKGTFLKLKNIEKFAISEKCKKVTVTPLSDNFRICIDGEITSAGKTEFEIIHNAFSFILP